MPSLRVLLLPFLALALLPHGGDARPRERDGAWEKASRGDIMPLPQVEQRARALPQVRGSTYLGPEFDGAATYRLKFMRGGKVFWVDVDARTGRVLGVAE